METQMILNHKAAIEYLVRDVERAGLSAETVIALHAFLSDGLMPDPLACGRLRSRSVEIGGSVYLPITLPQRLEELFGIVLRIAGEIDDPFEHAFFLMVHLPYLQPFEDATQGAGRNRRRHRARRAARRHAHSYKKNGAANRPAREPR